MTHGQYSEDVLKVTAQEFARAKEAFLAGRVVLIPTIDHIAYLVTAYSEDAVSVSESGTPIEGLCLCAKSTADVSSIGNCGALISQ